MGHMTAIAPDGPQLATFDRLEQKYQGQVIGSLVGLDSRGNELGEQWLDDAGLDGANLGISGFRVENWLWQLQHTALDFSQAHVAVVEGGISSQRYFGDTPNEIAKGIVQGARMLEHKMADGGHVYLVANYDCPEGTKHYSQAQNDALNHKLEAKAAASDGHFVFVDANAVLDFATDYDDFIHLNDSGNAKVQQQLLGAIDAHGDLPPPPEQLLGCDDPFTI